MLCRIGGERGGQPNYGKPHVPVAGTLDGKPITTCLYCGKTLQGLNEEMAWKQG